MRTTVALLALHMSIILTLAFMPQRKVPASRRCAKYERLEIAMPTRVPIATPGSIDDRRVVTVSAPPGKMAFWSCVRFE
jgi:hypothetical protein